MASSDKASRLARCWLRSLPSIFFKLIHLLVRQKEQTHYKTILFIEIDSKHYTQNLKRRKPRHGTLLKNTVNKALITFQKQCTGDFKHDYLGGTYRSAKMMILHKEKKTKWVPQDIFNSNNHNASQFKKCSFYAAGFIITINRVYTPSYPSSRQSSNFECASLWSPARYSHPW